MPAHAVTRAQAAESRRAATSQRSNRPQKRTSPGGSRSFSPARVVKLAASAATDGTVTLTGIASATGVENAYEMWDYFGEYTEVIAPGSFASTLNRADLEVPLVIGHDQIRRIASTMNGTLTLAETTLGLEMTAQVDMTDMDAAYIVPKIRAGLIQEMSFAFRITSGIWSPDYEQYSITNLDMHRGDVAIVGFGANPYTSVSLDGTPTGAVLVPCDCPDCGTCPDCPNCPCQCSCGGGKTLSAFKMSQRDRALALADIALAS
jgi:HK97 family phage prohead protease